MYAKNSCSCQLQMQSKSSLNEDNKSALAVVHSNTVGMKLMCLRPCIIDQDLVFTAVIKLNIYLNVNFQHDFTHF